MPEMKPQRQTEATRRAINDILEAHESQWPVHRIENRQIKNALETLEQTGFNGKWGKYLNEIGESFKLTKEQARRLARINEIRTKMTTINDRFHNDWRYGHPIIKRVWLKTRGTFTPVNFLERLFNLTESCVKITEVTHRSEDNPTVEKYRLRAADELHRVIEQIEGLERELHEMQEKHRLEKHG